VATANGIRLGVHLVRNGSALSHLGVEQGSGGQESDIAPSVGDPRPAAWLDGS